MGRVSHHRWSWAIRITPSSGKPDIFGKYLKWLGPKDLDLDHLKHIALASGLRGSSHEASKTMLTSSWIILSALGCALWLQPMKQVTGMLKKRIAADLSTISRSNLHSEFDPFVHFVLQEFMCFVCSMVKHRYIYILRQYVCMYACMHVCMHACMYVCMYVCNV